MARLWQFSQGHPRPAFSKNGQRGDQGKFFKTRPKRSNRLKNPKALWRKWHYPLICKHLNCKNWRRFRSKQRLQKCPNDQVMAIFARSAQTRLFRKSARAGPTQIFQNRPKSSPRLKGPKALWRKWHYSLVSMHLKCKDWQRVWRKQRLSKCPNGQVMAILARLPKNRIF